MKEVIATILVFVLVTLGHAAEAPKWQAEWQKTIEAAKKEGQLSLYGGQEITHPDIIAAFNKEFPFIRVTSASGRAADMLTRIVAERRADKYLADITASGPNGPRVLYLNKILDPITPTFILPEVTDASKWYGGKHWYADPENKYIFMFEGTIVTTGISYNTKMVQPDEIKTYWDLLQPKWKGKILAQDPRGAALLTPVLILYHRAGLGPDYLRKFYMDTDITLFRDRRQGTNWLATGKFPLCHLCREIDKAQQQGLPVDDLPPDKLKEGGTIGGGGSSVLALINKAPHPNAAKLFINWYLSRAGQMVWQHVMNVKEIEASDSMRVDIPKDDVLPEGKRAAGRQYEVIGFLDPEPVQKLLGEILK
ncbi:MAG: extracellular solute-binding protein [Deltaproteobacteria bacterium]|nr:extracellular solute-binding protein [Deltaproteobacteria bacterium]